MIYVPDWFVTQQQVKLWHDDDDYDEIMIRWYDGYKKWKAQKAKIKEELMPIIWDQSRWWDWCVSEDEKKRQKNFRHKYWLFYVCCPQVNNDAHRDNQIQAIEYEKVELQAQRDVYLAELQKCQDTIIHFRTRYVDHARGPGKDNIIIIVRKHTTPANDKDKYHDLPYYVVRIQ